MVIDMHYHLDERIETMDRLLDQVEQHGIGRVALMATLVDPLQVVGIAARFAAMGVKALMSTWCHGLGLLIYKSTVTADGNFWIPGKTYRIYDTPDNESVARVMQAHPDKFYGWIFVNPSAADPFTELERWAGQPGWIGVKSHPFWHRYPVAMLDDVAAYCSERSLPLLVHLGGNRVRGDYRYLPERHPHLKVIYPHAGVPFYREVWEYAKSRDGVFVDLSSPVYVTEPVRLGAVRALGAEKCLHGTDGPYSHATQGGMLQGILRLPISDADKERILGGNFREMMAT